MSPGRSRIVIRSVDGSCSGGDVRVSAGTETGLLSNKERIAISASVDSETRSLVASSANRRFSPGEGRAVMEGLGDVEMFSFTRSILLVLQNADISLSCHQNNTDSDLGRSNSVVVADSERVRQGTQPLPAGEAYMARRSKQDTAKNDATSWGSLERESLVLLGLAFPTTWARHGCQRER